MTAPIAPRVAVVEVGPSDGLQHEKPLPIATRVELIQRLAAAGLVYIEAGALVSPRWIPAMEGSDAVYRALDPLRRAQYPMLVPNEKGMQRAVDLGVREVAFITAASETFCQKNINCSLEESLDRFAAILTVARRHGIKVRGYVSCAAGCPYEGDVAPDRVAEVAGRLLEMGCREVSLGDTLGTGTPQRLRNLWATCERRIGTTERLAVHLHDTGLALVNLYELLPLGLTVIDTSIGGLGGCPYAPGAAGNVATEGVVHLLHSVGIDTGIDLEKLVDTAWWIAGELGRQPRSRVALSRPRGEATGEAGS